MEFGISPRAQEIRERLIEFMDAYVYPAEAVFEEQHRASPDRWVTPPIIEELKAKAPGALQRLRSESNKS